MLHYTDELTAEAALDILTDPAREVSAHYLIGRDGTLFKLVPEERRAWHAGDGAWGPIRDVNSHSIGIELDNDGASPFAEPLMATLEALLIMLMQTRKIARGRIIGHSDMAPHRKRDPGPLFPWQRLARVGCAAWPHPDFAPPGDIWADLAAFGYPVGHDGITPDMVLGAFRQRFRPGVDGPLDDTDRILAATLARRHPHRLRDLDD